MKKGVHRLLEVVRSATEKQANDQAE